MQQQQEAIVRLQRDLSDALAPDPDRVSDQVRREVEVGESQDRPIDEQSDVVRMLEALTKRMDSNEKKVDDYNSRVDQISGAPPILTGQETKYIVRRPFPPSATPKLIPKRFKMPDIPKYDGTTDPQEHITAYTCAIAGNDLEDDEIESVSLKKFGETLTKGAMQWYCSLPQHSIPSFELLADAFVKAHAGARKVQARKADIFKIFQRDDERLREFVTRFQRERMLLPPVPDEWATQAFTKGLNSRSSNASNKLKENLLEFSATTWADVHNRYESKIRVEDDQLGLPPGPVNRVRGDKSKRTFEPEYNPPDRYHPYPSMRPGFRSEKSRTNSGNRGDRRVDRGDRRIDRGTSSRGLQYKTNFATTSHLGENPRLSEYNFNVDPSTLVAAIGKIEGVTRPKPLRTDPSQRDPKLICDYHGTHGHRTDDCRGLRDEVARLLKNGHLREFLSERGKNNYKNREADRKAEKEEPQHVINMIIGGVEIPRGPILKRTRFSITREKRSRDYVPDGFISFNDEEVEGITQPHNDALVISVLIYKTHVKRILIDPGSSANIIRWKVVEQLDMLDQIIPTARILNGFNMASETTRGEITLPASIAGVVQHTKFYVIDGEMKYNALFGRPWIHMMKAVPSTLHQMLKFSTPDGIKIIRGEQPAAKEMFAVEEAVPNGPKADTDGRANALGTSEGTK
ncbi:uncharacterized protein LOC132044087 [Lycium ferocissimum]|uniref:uncharacterized protein LOC132044087 n=1 Tax=Lycium ferocissimum TaxID=112874 RepID=UPI002814E46D|nr:uncharacterized protein LOC132044087 [Lycium ferocissimum]